MNVQILTTCSFIVAYIKTVNQHTHLTSCDTRKLHQCSSVNCKRNTIKNRTWNLKTKIAPTVVHSAVNSQHNNYGEI